MQRSDRCLFDNRGLIPPFMSDPVKSDRSPYKSSLVGFVSDFSIACSKYDRQKRISILREFLEYRKRLHEAGLISGFQWINGSFVTYKELISNSAPNDIDVVSILFLPEGETEQSLVQKHSHLFYQDINMFLPLVDYYYVMLDKNKIELANILEKISYWNNLWSHERGSLRWKGYFQLDLSPTEDNLALEELNKISQGVEHA